MFAQLIEPFLSSYLFGNCFPGILPNTGLWISIGAHCDLSSRLYSLELCQQSFVASLPCPLHPPYSLCGPVEVPIVVNLPLDAWSKIAQASLQRYHLLSGPKLIFCRAQFVSPYVF